MNNYFYISESTNSQEGPVSADELIKHIKPETMIWRPGMAEWSAASTVAEIAQKLMPQPVAPVSQMASGFVADGGSYASQPMQGYPQQNGGYQQPMQGYPQQNGGYQQPMQGYPQQNGGYPQQPMQGYPQPNGPVDDSDFFPNYKEWSIALLIFSIFSVFIHLLNVIPVVLSIISLVKGGSIDRYNMMGDKINAKYTSQTVKKLLTTGLIVMIIFIVIGIIVLANRRY